MYCKNCGKEIDNAAAVCVNCGVATGNGVNFCPNCGAATNPGAAVCTNCGVALNNVPTANAAGVVGEQKSKLVAALLAFFLGGIGIHDFYLGYNKYGIIKIVLAVVTCGSVSSIWALIDFIRILTGNINTDANGVPLKNEF